MNPPPFDSLTAKERACLRLVGELKKTEAISFEIGLSPNTVNSYIASAMKKLRARNRREAALMLRAYESQLPEKFVSEPERLVDRPDPSILPTPAPMQGDQSRLNDVLVEMSNEDGSAIAWLSSRLGRNRNDLTVSQRLRAVFMIVMATVVVSFLMFAAFESLQRALWRLAQSN